jgi:hypothetical protein
MKSFPIPPNNFRIRPKDLWKPALVASLGLHSLFLLLPGQSDTVQKTEPRQIDEKPIRVTQLSRPKPKPTATQKPKPTAKPKPKPALTRKTPPPPPVLQVKQEPKKEKPKAAETESRSTEDKEEQKTPAPGTSPSPSPTPESEDNSEVDEVTKAFAAPMGELYLETDAPGGTGEKTREYYWKPEIPPAPEDFEDPSPFFADIASEKGKPGVATYVYLSPLRMDANTFQREMLEPAYTAAGFTMTKVGDYGGGPVYEVSKGTDKRYFSIVPGGSKAAGSGEFQQSGWMVVIWKQSPI